MNNCDYIYNQLCDNLIDKIKNFEFSCKELEEMLNLTVRQNARYQSISEFEVQAVDLKKIFHKKSKKCVVFGRTSSGKSSLINALLTEEILPTSCGSTSNSFVQIKASSSKREYIRINNEVKTLSSLLELTSLLCEGHVKNGSHIDLFFDRDKCDLLMENIEIVDTPGIDSDNELDDAVIQYCKDADLIIFVVNSIIGISLIEKEFLKKFRVQFLKLHVLIVFNFWDIPDKAKNKTVVHQQYMANATKLLTEELKCPNKHLNNQIFFLSAVERINFLSSDGEKESEKSLWKARNESFEQFFNTLKDELASLEHQRKADCLNGLHSLVLNIFNNRKASNMIMNERNKVYQIFNESINEIDKILTMQCITKLFKKLYEEFIREGNSKFQEFSNIAKELNINTDRKVLEINNKLQTLLHSIAKTHEEQLKSLIIKRIGETKMKNLNSWILTKFYFPNYFNFSYLIKNDVMHSTFLYNEIAEINTKIKRSEWSLLAKTSAAIAVTAVAGFFGSYRMAATILATASGLATYNSSTENSNNFPSSWKFYGKFEAKFIQIYLKKLLMKFTDNYLEFRNCLCRNFDSEFYKSVNNIQNNLNGLKTKIQKFENEL